VMLAYSPHWMNLEYELDYLEGGDLLESVNRPQTLHSAASLSLADEEPLARAFLGEVSLTENQIESLQLSIREAENPPEGARAWAATNDSVVRLWTSAARESAA
jgi:glycine betaine/proline transport system substrate-binding protein